MLNNLCVRETASHPGCVLASHSVFSIATLTRMQQLSKMSLLTLYFSFSFSFLNVAHIVYHAL